MAKLDQARPSTQCVHAGEYSPSAPCGVTTPIYTSTAFQFPNDRGEIFYPREFNVPTQEVVADKIRILEHAERGLVLSSGMAAITSTLLGLLRSGDHAVFHAGIYGGTRSLVLRFLERYGIEHSLVYSCEPSDFVSEFRDNTRIVFFESPTNPLLEIVDIRELARVSRERGITSIIDNTFATPISQNPIDLGVDVVVHSGTKYLNGHSDVNCGAIAGSEKLMAPIREAANHFGGTLDVRACYLLERGMKTLAVRVERQSQNAVQLARWLAGHRLVRRVYYPGLPEHKGHGVAARQMSVFGGMFSFELNTEEAMAKAKLARLRVATMAISLGGVETLVSFPKDTSHAKLSPEERHRAGISDTLARVSVGIEHVDDLVADFEQALSG
jgi:cystathionine beta-lyase